MDSISDNLDLEENHGLVVSQSAHELAGFADAANEAAENAEDKGNADDNPGNGSNSNN